MSSDTRSKTEILNELQSIRDFLTDGTHAEEEDIPTLTVVAPEVVASELVETETIETETVIPEDVVAPEIETAALDTDTIDVEDTENNNAEPAPVPQEDSTITDINDQNIDDEDELEALKAAYRDEIAEAENMDSKPPSDGDTPQYTHAESLAHTSQTNDADAFSAQSDSVQHSTQSNPTESQPPLFQLEPPLIPPASKAHHTYTAPVSQSSDLETMPKGAGENPFLPPHIRERLGKHKDIAKQFEEFSLQQATANTENKTTEIQGDLLIGFNAPPKVSTPKLDSHIESESIIEEILSEMMPKIENRLREKLNSALNSWKDEQ